MLRNWPIKKKKILYNSLPLLLQSPLIGRKISNPRLKYCPAFILLPLRATHQLDSSSQWGIGLQWNKAQFQWMGKKAFTSHQTFPQLFYFFWCGGRVTERKVNGEWLVLKPPIIPEFMGKDHYKHGLLRSNSIFNAEDTWQLLFMFFVLVKKNSLGIRSFIMGIGR